MSEYSVESLQHLILSQHSSTSTEVIAALRAFQERIKADEGVVPTAWITKAMGDEILCWDKPHHVDDTRPTPLFTHPPAQAAQVDAAKSMKACPEHQVKMLMARAVASGVVIPDAPPACPSSLSDIVKLLVNSYPVAAIVREMDAQAPGIRGAFAPLAPTAEPAATEVKCSYCDNTGDVHSIDGKWRGKCTECQAAMDGEFKNFRRQLCERFGYAHDEIDWRRDQISLIEFIAAQPRAVPDGWVLVPVEPTMRMEDAGANALRSGRVTMFKRCKVNRIYHAMLAAAPSPGESA